jgi:hypothetical protein
MSAPYSTLLLDVGLWDLTLDANGNIAVAGPPYSLAQDVASACRTVLGEVYYDTTIGVDYFGQLFGKTPPLSVLQEQFVQAALTVPGVTGATCVIASVDVANRTIKGQVQFVDVDGNSTSVSIG